MTKSILVFISATIFTTVSFSAATIKGNVFDQISRTPLAFANIVILDSVPLVGTTTDEDGNFSLTPNTPGRIIIKVSYIGYDDQILTDILFTGSEDLSLMIGLKESGFLIQEVAITPRIQKAKALNPLAGLSGRSLHIEETSRFAGGFNDPARLASSYAGVSNRLSSNGMVVRGNAPKHFQWKLEGVEIPNPNHFANLSSFGGGGLTALSSHVMDNSDLLISAMPAEYNNSVSGVLDLNMRIGNREHHNHRFQIGGLGIDFSSEGPIMKSKKSSYLFNYRYSTLGLIQPLLPEDAGGTNYQDLSFKLNFPSLKNGVFNFWGIALLDQSGQQAEMNPAQWEYDQDNESSDVGQGMAAFGIKHKKYITDLSYLETKLAATTLWLDLYTEKYYNRLSLNPWEKIHNNESSTVFSSYYINKLSAFFNFKMGFLLDYRFFDMNIFNLPREANDLTPVVEEKGSTLLGSIFWNNQWQFHSHWEIIFGLNASYFVEAEEYSLEPRLQFLWRPIHFAQFGLGYGKHSRIEPIHTYFIGRKDPTIPSQIGYTKSDHYVMNSDFTIGQDWHLRLDLYLQHLYNIPYSPVSNISLINIESDWFFGESVIKGGKAKTYGLDLTIEKYMTKGIYALLSMSLGESIYSNNHDNWYNTNYKTGHRLNFLIGKEWFLGPQQKKRLGVNFQIIHQGGNYYTPIDLATSLINQEATSLQHSFYTKRFGPAFQFHFTLQYTISKNIKTHEFALNVINATGFKEFVDFRYNYLLKTVDEYKEAIILPNISYAIKF